MAAYHEELAKAGMLLDGSGLQPSAKGWRIKYDGNKRMLVDGPFAETKELIAGYTIIQASRGRKRSSGPSVSRTRSVAANAARSRCRQLYELEDFGPSTAIERFRDIGIG